MGAFGHKFLTDERSILGFQNEGSPFANFLEGIRKTDVGSGNWRYHWCIEYGTK